MNYLLPFSVKLQRIWAYDVIEASSHLSTRLLLASPPFSNTKISNVMRFSLFFTVFSPAMPLFDSLASRRFLSLKSRCTRTQQYRLVFACHHYRSRDTAQRRSPRVISGHVASRPCNSRAGRAPNTTDCKITALLMAERRFHYARLESVVRDISPGYFSRLSLARHTADHYAMTPV